MMGGLIQDRGTEAGMMLHECYHIILFWFSGVFYERGLIEDGHYCHRFAYVV